MKLTRRTRTVVLTIAVALATFLASLGYLLGTASEWDLEGLVGIYGSGGTSVVLDSEDNIHIAFYEKTHDEPMDWLGYGLFSGGVWATHRIQPLDNESYTSMALDPDGGVHIVVDQLERWQHEPANEIMYATNVGGWRTEMVQTADVPLSKAIAFDAAGVHLFYTENETNPVLKVASRGESGWTTTEIQVGDRVPYYVWSVQPASSGGWHMLLTFDQEENGTEVFRRAYAFVDGNVTTVWDVPSAVFGVVSMALDLEGGPVIGLEENTTGIPRLSLARLVDGDWAYEPIAKSTNPDHNGIPSLTFDRQGSSHVTLSLGEPGDFGDLWYATDKDGKWALSKVDEPMQPSNQVFCAPIVVDSTGKVSIFYHRMMPPLGEKPFQLIHATNVIDQETRMTPFVIAVGWSVAAAVCVLTVQLAIARQRK